MLRLVEGLRMILVPKQVLRRLHLELVTFRYVDDVF